LKNLTTITAIFEDDDDNSMVMSLKNPDIASAVKRVRKSVPKNCFTHQHKAI